MRQVLLALARTVGEQIAPLRIEVLELALAELLVLPEIVVGAVSDAFELSETR